MSEQTVETNQAEQSAGLPTKETLLEALKVVKDPEIPVNVVDLGLIYDLTVKEGGEVDVEMTLTSMGCPVQDMIQADAELACMKVEGRQKGQRRVRLVPALVPGEDVR